MKRALLALFFYVVMAAPGAAGEWHSNHLGFGISRQEIPFSYPTKRFFNLLSDSCNAELDFQTYLDCKKRVARIGHLSFRMSLEYASDRLGHKEAACDKFCIIQRIGLHYMLLSETSILLSRYPAARLAILPGT